ncbi:ATP-dependent DNA ligase [Candidatus Woesearchaeota archaeon]|nr:MAG: ATP-dependent DNA ligase [Candidatus Woesearchaeota archaeon]
MGVAYSELVGLYQRLEGTSKRLEKTFYIADFLRKAVAEGNASDRELSRMLLLIQGRIFPPWDERKIGVAAKLVIKSIAHSTGISESRIEDLWREKGDLGTVASELVKKKVQATLLTLNLTLDKVFDNLLKLAALTGQGAVSRKVQMISELLTSASPGEAKYIVRTVLEELRVGVGEGSVRDALAWAFFPAVEGILWICGDCKARNPEGYDSCLSCSAPKEESAPAGRESSARILEVNSTDELLELERKRSLNKYDLLRSPSQESARAVYNFIIDAVQTAYDIKNDFGEVAVIAREKGLAGLRGVELVPGKPIKVMLAQKVSNVKEAFERVGRPAAVEYKYDGFRMQVHKKGQNIRIFTRRMEEVTEQFPEVVEFFRDYKDDFVLDGEAVGYDPKTGRFMPFQHISQRIKRKYKIEELSRELPVELNLFDIMFLDSGDGAPGSMLNRAFRERRKALEKLIREKKGSVVLAKQLVTDRDDEAEAFYKESLEKGNEGVMFKGLENPYKPGSRVGFMVKLKPTMESLDLVITAAEWGEGKRANWLTSFTLSCIDENGEYIEIGKVGTGIKELESQAEEGEVTFEQLTRLLKPLIIEQKGRKVTLKPEVIVEVKYEEIQRSPTYSSGFALRFPRVVRIRDDLNPEEASSITLVEELYRSQ